MTAGEWQYGQVTYDSQIREMDSTGTYRASRAIMQLWQPLMGSLSDLRISSVQRHDSPSIASSKIVPLVLKSNVNLYCKRKQQKGSSRLPTIASPIKIV